MRLFAFPILFLIFNTLTQAQEGTLDFSYSIKFRTALDISDFLIQNDPEHYVLHYEALSTNGQFYTLTFQKSLSKDHILKWLRNQSEIDLFQPVVPMRSRGCNPNDSAYLGQYDMELMKFDEVWCYKSNGLNPFGDTLVVGVIDNGFNYQLRDLAPNIFINYGEIPDNGIDDDQNGYKDDYYGLNAKSFSEGDNHNSDTHGTQVISVVGAKGNNKLDITGTNQNIKILLCSAASSDQLVKCYHYFVKMKRDYVNSGGKKGAFIVSSNLSAGFDGYFPQDLPLICSAYDSLGSVGILSSVATINDNEDIGLVGDIPGLCPSIHMITVTNTNRFDKKVVNAGYNKDHVDLGACGEEIPMLDQFGTVREESGCSFSSPHVAGLVSLLYQFCPKINELNKTQSILANTLMRGFILNFGTQLTDLTGITSSGKRLNAIQSLQGLNEYCNTMDSLSKTLEIRPNPVTDALSVYFKPKDFGKYKVLIYNSLAQICLSSSIVYEPDTPVEHTYNLSGWAQGIYFLLIEGENNKISERIIKI